MVKSAEKRRRLYRNAKCAIVAVAACCLSAYVYGQSGDSNRAAKIQPLVEWKTGTDVFAPTYSVTDSILRFCVTAKRGVHVSSIHYNQLTQANVFPKIIDSGSTSLAIYATTSKGIRISSQLSTAGGRLHHTLVQNSVMNGVLSQPDFLDQVNDRASSSLHPTLSPDGTMLVFCSDRTGGEGGTDLWISTFSNGQWNIPINAGTELNSNANEITPCFLGNDSLLFASNGFGGKGGYDLYITIRKAGEWLPPTPLLHLNSVFDESDPCVLPDGRIIFASNRNGKNRTLYLAPPVSIE